MEITIKKDREKKLLELTECGAMINLRLNDCLIGWIEKSSTTPTIIIDKEVLDTLGIKIRMYKDKFPFVAQ